MSHDAALADQVPDVSLARIPRHMGVIMDGNGRWAAARGRPRTEGHRAGMDALARLVELASEAGIEYLTVFSFSSENWRRPEPEITFLFSLLRRFVATGLDRLISGNVRARIIGDRSGLDEELRTLIQVIETRTAKCTGLNLNIAFNYGSRQELAAAVRVIARQVASGELDAENVGEAAIEAALTTAGMPAPDLIVRTGGDHRLSNFLLWQSAYAELVFVEENWPSFDDGSFNRVLGEFARRERRYGGLSAGDRPRP